MTKRASGEYVTVSKVGGEVVRAFVPHPLPPQRDLAFSPALRDALDRALVALGR
jgi:hypothetical protein